VIAEASQLTSTRISKNRYPSTGPQRFEQNAEFDLQHSRHYKSIVSVTVDVVIWVRKFSLVPAMVNMRFFCQVLPAH
jgi:hypothetical protein